MYKLAKSLGYRLRKCARCRRPRLLPSQPKPAREKGTEPAELEGPAKSAETDELIDLPEAADSEEEAGAKDPDSCPRCGSKDYRRSRRRSYERLIGRPPMARCRACRYRFPFPQY